MVDDCTRECLALIADTSISGTRVARELDRLLDEGGKPKTIVSDNGTELTSNAILRWADDHKVNWHYIAPGKPVQNGLRGVVHRTPGDDEGAAQIRDRCLGTSAQCLRRAHQMDVHNRESSSQNGTGLPTARFPPRGSNRKV